MKGIWFISFSLLLAIGCQRENKPGEHSSEKSETDQLIDYVNKLDTSIDSVQSSYIILPVDVCTFCIEKLKHFLQAQPVITTQIILSGKSLKQVKATFGTQLLNQRNVHLDTLDLWNDSGLKREEVPEVFFAIDGEIISRVSLNASNMDESLLYLESWEAAQIHAISFSNLRPDLVNMIGKEAPHFSSQALNGDLVEIAKETSKVTLVNFWSDRCAYCLIEMPILNRIFREYGQQDVELISVYRDSETSLLTYFEKYGNDFIEFPVIPDAKEITERYGVQAFPTSFIINQHGVISNVSGFTKGPGEVISSKGVSAKHPFYYKVLRGQIERLLVSNNDPTPID